jgi:hypothetical protein
VATGCKSSGGSSIRWVPALESMELATTVNQLKFGFTWPDLGVSETSTSKVTYVSPAKSVHVSGAVGGTYSGVFAADFTIANGKAEPITVK